MTADPDVWRTIARMLKRHGSAAGLRMAA